MQAFEAERDALQRRVEECRGLPTLSVEVQVLEALLLNDCMQRDEVRRLRNELAATADAGQVAMCQKYRLREGVLRLAGQLRFVANARRLRLAPRA